MPRTTPKQDATPWRADQKTFSVDVMSAFLVLQLLFLGLTSLLYGSQHNDENRVHALNVLPVDYVGGVTGQSMLDAYDSLKSPSFP